MISLIAAIGKNNELGKDNDLIWRLPSDQKYFREITSGHTVISGRKNFEAMGRPLANRRNIIITRDQNYKKEGIEVAHSLEEALSLAKKTNADKEIFVIGGGEIYKQSMPIADKLYITHIDADEKEANVFFPEIIPVLWNEVSHEEHKRDIKNLFDYTFSVYEKFI